MDGDKWKNIKMDQDDSDSDWSMVSNASSPDHPQRKNYCTSWPPEASSSSSMPTNVPDDVPYVRPWDSMNSLLPSLEPVGAAAPNTQDHRSLNGNERPLLINNSITSSCFPQSHFVHRSPHRNPIMREDSRHARPVNFGNMFNRSRNSDPGVGESNRSCMKTGRHIPPSPFTLRYEGPTRKRTCPEVPDGYVPRPLVPYRPPSFPQSASSSRSVIPEATQELLADRWNDSRRLIPVRRQPFAASSVNPFTGSLSGERDVSGLPSAPPAQRIFYDIHSSNNPVPAHIQPLDTNRGMTCVQPSGKVSSVRVVMSGGLSNSEHERSSTRHGRQDSASRSTEHIFRPEFPGSSSRADRIVPRSLPLEPRSSQQHSDREPNSSDTPGSNSHANTPGSNSHLAAQGSGSRLNSPGPNTHFNGQGSSTHMNSIGSASHITNSGSNTPMNSPAGSSHIATQGSSTHLDALGTNSHLDIAGPSSRRDLPGPSSHQDLPGPSFLRDTPGSRPRRNLPSSHQDIRIRNCRRDTLSPVSHVANVGSSSDSEDSDRTSVTEDQGPVNMTSSYLQSDDNSSDVQVIDPDVSNDDASMTNMPGSPLGITSGDREIEVANNENEVILVDDNVVEVDPESTQPAATSSGQQMAPVPDLVEKLVVELPNPNASGSAASATFPSKLSTSQNKEGLNEGIMAILECPVCLEYMAPPIFQCHRGHLVCSTCKPRLLNCPTCRAPFSDSRNLAMEQVAERVSFPCKNSPHGCREYTMLKDKENHEMSCPCRIYKCLLPHCNWSGMHPRIASHLLEMHTKYLRKPYEQNWKQRAGRQLPKRKVRLDMILRERLPFKLNLQIVLKNMSNTQSWIVCADKEVFKISFQLSVKGHNNMQLSGCVQYIGPECNCQNYKYKIKLVSKPPPTKKWSFSSPVLSDRHRSSHYHFSGETFSVGHEIIQVYCEGTHEKKVMKVEVSVAEIPVTKAEKSL